ncbi:3-phosphoglycerate dehydrogenase [Heterostelium album PN500]|uniref:2-oxoglutarate reductase n=1 Tax=Heterostelium pallidum (strain ATCC 26659 / Pp 5 / PN500) TaxID=670386 RepID=D3BSP0_HETP5|nr:3-phosphoglycerate dehydrogenase [Heterostelium album PN500]EFA75505.1 3-phosphoglycerate dehydrogenase [Heterostelium album PN500]|eukprot:XP_020427639.1 3-phosphoglycerate dehydrogenase [Heterostelium album PN500]
MSKPIFTSPTIIRRDINNDIVSPSSPTNKQMSLLTSAMNSPDNAATLSFPKEKIKVLLLENIHSVAIQNFKDQGFNVESLSSALSEDQLIEKIKDVHVLGLRSKTKVTAKVLAEAKRLMAIGCFCIGTDQVDLPFAESRGVPVFNSPFCNSRSVEKKSAELMIAEIIVLSRKIGDRSREMHNKVWRKESKNCHEIRGKVLGIIGYGHIGSQLSVLAEAMGMNVVYYDTARKLPLGNSKACPDMKSLLEMSNYVTLHVPDTEQTRNMIGKDELAMMRSDAYLLNASRGKVVDIAALADALKGGRLAGAAVDVYPSEPEANCNDWENVLQGCPNTILTPHIGGSTEEAQEAIGSEVSELITCFINTGGSEGSVNFPEISIPVSEETHRILNIHHNKPGVLRDINLILSEFNVSSQILSTRKQIGYIIADVDKEASKEIKRKISALPHSIKTRVLY